MGAVVADKQPVLLLLLLLLLATMAPTEAADASCRKA